LITLPLDSELFDSCPTAGGGRCPPWLIERLREAGGWLPWVNVMEMALYDPHYGYYSGTPRRIGRQGDFYTAVSIGPLYGRLIAMQAAQLWEVAGRPDKWVLAEQAAHDGQLMEDMLVAIQAQHLDLAAVLEVILIEPQAEYREVQERRLRRVWQGPIRWVAVVGELDATAGLLVCNELLDAFAVHRVVWEGGQWLEMGVFLDENGSKIEWAGREIESEDLRAELKHLPVELPEGFVTEVPVSQVGWVSQLGESGFRGSVWIADYGLDAGEYWSVERPSGTLRRYWNHQMDDRVLENLGEADLTCHVNFTRIQEQAAAVGVRLVDYADQGRFLTRLAGPWLASLDGKAPGGETAALLRQFQSLTHPGIMGRSFRVMLLARS